MDRIFTTARHLQLLQSTQRARAMFFTQDLPMQRFALGTSRGDLNLVVQQRGWRVRRQERGAE
jgi:hypothetical protein